MNDTSKYTEILTECKDLVERKQIGFLLGRQRAALDPSLEIEEDLNQIISNTKLSEFFKQLARDLDVLEPKTAEQTLKTHLEERKQNDVADSAKENLATTYVNGLVNAAFCKDLLLTVEGGDSWVHKNKDHGMMAAAASLGMLMLWDIDQGLTDIDKYCNVNNEYIVAGAYIGIGIVNSGIKNECDPVYAILHEALENSAARQITKIGALIGLSLTYAGSKRQDLLDDFSPIILDSSNSIELQAVAALSIGLVYVGSCNEDAAQSILQTLMEKESKDLEHPFAKLFSIGLGLLFLGEEDLCEASLEACGVLQDANFAEYTKLLIDTLAYSGTGNVLKIQKLLHLLSEHKTEEKEALHQVAATLGVAFIAFGEDVGQDMCIRTLNQLLTYGEPIIKKIVPLAIGLLRISNPDIATIDMLTKLAYDSNEQIAQNAIFALGLVGSGSNNSRLAGNLRMLASYYNTKKDTLFVVRLAQGLIHMGKVRIFHNLRVCLHSILSILTSSYTPESSLPGLLSLSLRHQTCRTSFWATTTTSCTTWCSACTPRCARL
jgi:26S proteasome regulatory subunit N1